MNTGIEKSNKKEKFVLYLDIMGFKERVNRVEIENLREQLLRFKTKNNKLKPLLESKANTLIYMAQFSDSIVLVSRDTTIDDLNRISKAATILMQYDYPQLADRKFGRIPENAYLCTKLEIPLQDEAI